MAKRLSYIMVCLTCFAGVVRYGQFIRSWAFHFSDGTLERSSRKFEKKKSLILLFFFGIWVLAIDCVKAQSFRTITLSGNATDFNNVEKYSAAANNTDYYVTFDAGNIYFGAFRTIGTFGSTDNFTIYIDNDPDATATSGTGTTTGQTYNGVSGSLPFSANYNVHVEESYQEARSFGSNWAATIAGVTYSTSATAREVKIPFSSIGNPNSLYITVWMGYANGFFSNAPGANLGASGNPTITDYFGGFGVSSADCIPKNITNTAITDAITNGVPASGTLYGKVIVNAGTVTATNNFNVAPGGSIVVSGGVFDISGRTIQMGGTTIGDGRGSTINTNGTGVLTTSSATVFTFNGEGNITGNPLTSNGSITINRKFTPLASGNFTIGITGIFDLRANSYINSNGPAYASGSELRYNTGGSYTASAEWTANAASGTGVPSKVTIGNAVANSGVNFGTSAQYRQVVSDITISNGTAGSFLTLSTNAGGDLRVGGSFTNNGTFTHNTRAITFNGTTAQTISGTLSNGTAATNILTNVTISNTSANVTATSNINISSGLIVNVNSRLDIGTTTLTLNTGSSSTVNGYLRNAGTVTTNNTLTFSSTGTYEHNYTASGTNLGAIPTATWNTGSTCSIIGLTNPTAGSWFTPAASATQSFSNFTWNTTSLATAPNMSGAILTVDGIFSIISTGTSELRVGAGTITGAINCASYSQSGGILNLSSGTGTGTINCTGAFNQSAGTITETSSGSGVINLIQTTGTQNLTVSGTVSNTITWNIGSGATTNTVQLQSSMNAGGGAFNILNNATIDFGTTILSGTNAFDLQSGSTLITANTNGIYATTATGSVQSSGTRTYNSVANYTFNGVSSQITGAGLTAANNLTINNSNGVALTSSVTVSNILTLQSGKLSLGTNSLTVSNTSTSAITSYSPSNYISTNGTGELRRAIGITSFPLNYVFPVGITSYTPVSYNFTDNTVATNLYVRVVESSHPSVATTDYIQNRYWITNLSDATGTYIYSATYNFISGDVFGTQANIKLSRWNGLSWGSVAGSSSTGTTLNSGTVTESSAPLQSTAEWCGRSSPTPTNYTWNISGTGSWNITSNWLPVGIPSDGDAVTFSNASTSIVTNVPTGIRLTKFSLSGNTNITLQAGSSGALNIGSGTSPQFNVASSSTLVVGGSTGLTLNIVSGNTGTVQGTIQLKEGAHKLTAESASGLTFSSASYFAAGVLNQTTYSGNPFGSSGSSNTIVFQSGSVFEQFEGSNPFALSQPSTKVNFQSGSLYKFSNTNAIAVPSFSGRTYANFEYNVNQSKSVSGTGGFTIQNLTVTQGIFTIALTASSNIQGNITVANGTTFDINPSSATAYNINGSTQNVTVNGTGIFSLGSNTSLVLANGTTVNMIGESAITGAGAFTVTSGGSLGIASVNGISSSGSSGNIQTTTRTFNSGGNYTYNGSSNQVTGNGMPVSMTGAVTIANTGLSGSNTVTLTTTNTSASTLNLSAGIFAIGNGQQFNMNTAGLVNGTGGDFASGTAGGTINFTGSGTFTGNLNPYNLYASGGVNFGAQTVTVNGTFRINTSGFAVTNAPYYATGSTLQYNSGGTYDRVIEWNNNSGRGNPYNVTVSNNTTLNYPNGANFARTIAGDLTIDAGSSFYMDYGSTGMSNPLTVTGNVTANGNLSLGDAFGGDLILSGNWTRGAGTFSPNNREVEFNGTALQTLTGATTFDYLKINNNGNIVQLASAINIDDRLWLNNGAFNPNGNTVTMSSASLVRRSAAAATMTQSPTAATGNSFDMQYDAGMTSGSEFLNDQTRVRDLLILAGTLTLNGNKTINRDLKLSGNMDLATYTFTDRGNNILGTAAGNIEITTSGTKTINGSAGSIFDIIGIAGNNPAYHTKIVTNPTGAGSLTFGSNVVVQIGDGRMDFGNGSPVTINGVLQIALGGSVFPYPCYYGTNSILRFANLIDYQVPNTDITWSAGVINSGLPGIPYHVDVLNAGTDLTLQSARALKGNLTITDGTFTMTAASGTFNIGGNWLRSGSTSTFNHNNQKVIFDRQTAGGQTITTSNSVTGETFYDLETSLNSGTLDLSSNTNLTVLNNLNLLAGNLTISSNTVLLLGTVTGSSAFTGSVSSNMSIGGAAGGSVGTLNFTAGSRLLNNMTISRTGAGATALLGTDLDVTGTLTITNPATLTMGSSGQLLTITGYISGTGTLTGSSSSNLTIAGSGTNAGTLYFTTGSQFLNIFTINRTGTAPAAVMGSSLTSNALTLTNGILPTGNNLLTITAGSGITLPAAYTNSYVCLCDAAGTNPVSFTKPFNGSIGLRINNVGNSNNFFPVGVDFVSPNKMLVRNQGDPDDLTVVMEKGDIGSTDKPRVNRIWYVNQANPSTKRLQSNMRLYFTKRTGIFPSVQDEIENGFIWTDTRLVQKAYSDPNYLNVAQNSDIQNWLSASYDNTEVWGEYNVGVSPNVNGNTFGIDSFTRFSVVNISQFILPVTIINLRAEQQGRASLVSWTSLAELNVSHYEILRSCNGSSFVSTGTVQASDKGTQRAEYSYTDALPLTGKNYYRIKAVDKDGKVAYSNTVSLNITNTGREILVYPNPVYRGGTLTITARSLKAGSYTINITSAEGKTICSYRTDHNGGNFFGRYMIPGNAAQGTYFVTVAGETIAVKEKIIVQ